MNEFNLNKKYNWETAHNPLVKKYVANLIQAGAGNPPTATELFNNTDVYFTYEYALPGIYTVTASKPIFEGSYPFETSKAVISITNVSIMSTFGGYSVFVSPVTEDTFVIYTSDLVNFTDSILGQATQNTLEITIYP